MSIKSKVRQVEHLFEWLEYEISKFHIQANLRCRAECVKCCFSSNIDAPSLELLPWGFH